MQPGSEFFEDDEPVEKVAAAFREGSKVVTGPAEAPVRGWTQYLRVPSSFFPSVNEPAGHAVAR
jgi:hypothetical protein